jgi:hypothetical protein
VFGTWEWSIDEKTELAASAGPAVIYPSRTTPPRTCAIDPLHAGQRNFTAPVGFVDILGDSREDFREGCSVSQERTVPAPERPTRVLINTPAIRASYSPGGQALAEAIQDADTVVNQNPGGETSTDVTVFADVVLTRHWSPNLHTAFHYSREQGNASGLGGSVVSDSVIVSNTWQITEKWQLAARGEWGLRTSLSEQGQVNTRVFEVDSTTLGAPPGGIPLAGVCCDPDPPSNDTTGTSFTQRDDTTDIDTMRWGVASRVTRFFTRNTSGYLQFTYNQQGSQSNSLGDPSDFEDYLVTLGVQHVFSPIKLW